MRKQGLRDISPELCRAVYEKWLLEGMSHQQIADIYGISRKRVGKIIYWANVGGADPKETSICYEGIAKYLTERNMSVRQFGRKCGLNPQGLYRILAGEGKNGPTKKVIDKILVGTGMSYEEAFGAPEGEKDGTDQERGPGEPGPDSEDQKAGRRSGAERTGKAPTEGADQAAGRAPGRVSQDGYGAVRKAQGTARNAQGDRNGVVGGRRSGRTAACGFACSTKDLLIQMGVDALKHSDHPCKQDCPDRSAECKKSCLKYYAWELQYLKEKAEPPTTKNAVEDYFRSKSAKAKKIRNRSRKPGRRLDRDF